jgi:hypothetical protein
MITHFTSEQQFSPETEGRSLIFIYQQYYFYFFAFSAIKFVDLPTTLIYFHLYEQSTEKAIAPTHNFQ